MAKGDGLKTVDIVDANVNLGSSNDKLTINFKLELIDYSRGQNKFKIRAYLPKELSEYTGKEFYEFEKDYITYGNRNKMDVEEHIVINSDNEDARRSLTDSQWYQKDFEYELYNEKEVIKVIDHGL